MPRKPGSSSLSSHGPSRRRRSPAGRHFTAQRGVKTSWDPLAEWYDGWMGQTGSKHHQLVLPTVQTLMAIQPGERVLDLGCGQGVLAESVQQAQGEYVGVDASNTLISLAQQRHGQAGRFLVGDVTQLSHLGKPQLTAGSFDVAVFLLSIQDIDPLAKAFQQAAWALKDQGRLVILMIHPAFRIARQSGWGFDERRKLQYRRVDQYLTPNKIPLKEYPGKQKGVSFTFHRPLQEYIGSLANNGLLIDACQELSTAEWITPQTPRAQARAIREIPLFLALRARKISL